MTLLSSSLPMVALDAFLGSHMKLTVSKGMFSTYSGRIIVESSSVVGPSSEETQIEGTQEDGESTESAQSDE